MADNTQAPTDNTQAQSDITPEEALSLLNEVMYGAFSAAVDAGLSGDMSKITFDLSADDGSITVSGVDASGKEVSQTVSASEVESKLSAD